MFAPISASRFLERFLKDNPSEKRKVTEDRLQDALKYALAGGRCTMCKTNPVWVVGAAAGAGYLCFTCTTGDAVPDDDFEIDEHLRYLYKNRSHFPLKR